VLADVAAAMVADAAALKAGVVTGRQGLVGMKDLTIAAAAAATARMISHGGWDPI
jgi:hypothetical protein